LTSKEELIWSILESEAPEKFYINDAKKPAFLYFPKWHHFAWEKKHTIYMNSIGLLGTFRSRRKAFAKLREIIETANEPVKVYRVSKTGRDKGKRVFFAEKTENDTE